MKVPVIDLTICQDCEVCQALCPGVFHKTPLGFMEIVELDVYPQNEVDEAIKNCPAKCISWEERVEPAATANRPF